MRKIDRRYVEIVNLTKAYPNPFGQEIAVVKDFNLILHRGEVVSVIGHSGCGKSTVLTMLAGLNPISAGSLVVDSREVEGPGPDRAVVFQAPCLLPWMTSLENVMLGVKQVYPHGTKAERRQICEYYLSIVGLADSMHKYPQEMSGGMQQRVGIARAIALKPRMLLLDEPFGRLDSLTRMDLQDVILDILNRERITTMVITHDVDEAIYMADRVCMMTNGPEACVGQILEVPFECPRNRSVVLEHPHYYDFRASLISFLEKQEHVKEEHVAQVEERQRLERLEAFEAQESGRAGTRQRLSPASCLSSDETDVVSNITIGNTRVIMSVLEADSGPTECQTTLVRYFEIWTPAEDGESLELKAARLADGTDRIADIPVQQVTEGEGLAGRAWHQQSATILQEAPSELLDAISRESGVQLMAVVAVPLFGNTGIRGVIVLGLGPGAGSVEVWSRDDRDELSVSSGYYSELPAFEYISRYVRFPKGGGLPGNVWKTGRPSLVQNLPQQALFVRALDKDPERLQAGLGLPISSALGFASSVLLLLSGESTPLFAEMELWHCENVPAEHEDVAPSIRLTSTTRGSSSSTDDPLPWQQSLAANVAALQTPLLAADDSSLPEEFSMALCVPVFQGSEIVGIASLIF